MSNTSENSPIERENADAQSVAGSNTSPAQAIPPTAPLNVNKEAQQVSNVVRKKLSVSRNITMEDSAYILLGIRRFRQFTKPSAYSDVATLHPLTYYRYTARVFARVSHSPAWLLVNLVSVNQL